MQRGKRIARGTPELTEQDSAYLCLRYAERYKKVKEINQNFNNKKKHLIFLDVLFWFVCLDNNTCSQN